MRTLLHNYSLLCDGCDTGAYKEQMEVVVVVVVVGPCTRHTQLKQNQRQQQQKKTTPTLQKYLVYVAPRDKIEDRCFTLPLLLGLAWLGVAQHMHNKCKVDKHIHEMGTARRHGSFAMLLLCVHTFSARSRFASDRIMG